MKKFFWGMFAIVFALVFSAKAAPPIIVSPPQSLTINNASSASFTVVASNAVSYQWQFQGGNILNATNATLSLENVATNQAGAYTVVVRSSDTSLTSQPPALLTLVPGTVVRFIFSGLLGGGTNYVDVQMFDHDKPITVQNFIHYITAGGYSNMFFDRCIPGFILQGGGYGASNRTVAASPVSGWQIASLVQSGNYASPFPTAITNEFNNGPLIHNDFGTIAMAKAPGQINSAANAFFFNLADNSANLDAQNGGFTVFGRVISPASALQYFNTLTAGDGLVGNGVFLDNGTLYAGVFPNLPVNYAGTNLPANANLVFGDFQFLTTDTNPPTLAVLSPAPGIVSSNGSAITVQGTASDNIGLAWVRAELIPLRESNGGFPNGGMSITNYTFGLTNWALTLNNSAGVFGVFPPGPYTLEVETQDEAGNNTQQSQPLTVGLPTPPAQILAPRLSGTNLTFNVPSYTNQYYVIWNCVDLRAMSWTPVSYFVGTGAPFQVAEPASGALGQQFFSVQAVNF